MRTDDQTTGPDEPESATGELARRCGLCNMPIAAQFFTLRNLLICPACASNVIKRQEGDGTGRPGRPGQQRRPLFLGLFAAAVFATLWFLTVRATGRPLSPLAVIAGLVVGMAMHRGSGGRGGLRLQVIAALLVYATFVIRYVPPVFSGIADAIKEQHNKKRMDEYKRDTPAITTPETTRQLAQSGKAIEKHISTMTSMSEQYSASATIKAYVVFALIAWGLVIAAPFLPNASGLFGTLCLAAGMTLAWRLNRRERVLGPFPSSN